MNFFENDLNIKIDLNSEHIPNTNTCDENIIYD
jgi:hypothetical protein